MNPKQTATPPLFDLADLSIAKVSGDDATEFLQGQLSNDIKLLGDKISHQLSAYCNPKGRVLALFHVLKLDTDYALIAPADVLTKVLPRLRMFVMRSAVNIEPLDNVKLIGAQLLHGTIPQSLASENTENISIVQHSIDPDRFFLLNTDSALITNMGINEWNCLDIQQNIPQIYPQLHETLIPQSINLDIIGGVNFKKGCYPGQEIIARVKYRGKPKTRMIAVRTAPNKQIEIGASIYIDGRDNAAGIVTNIANDENGTLLSITVPSSHIASGSLYLDTEKTNELNRLPGFYEVTI